MWPATLAALRTSRALPLSGRVVQPERPFQHSAEHGPHDASKDPQHTPLVLGQTRLAMLNSPGLQILGRFQQPRYDR